MLCACLPVCFFPLQHFFLLPSLLNILNSKAVVLAPYAHLRSNRFCMKGLSETELVVTRDAACTKVLLVAKEAVW